MVINYLKRFYIRTFKKKNVSMENNLLDLLKDEADKCDFRNKLIKIDNKKENADKLSKMFGN